MSEKLDLILEKLSLLESKVYENIELTKALCHRQEETDAKLEALSMDVHKLHGELSSVKSTLKEIKENMATKDDLTYFDKKIGEHDRELFKIKHCAETFIVD